MMFLRFFRRKPKPHKELYAAANRAARNRMLQMAAVEYLEKVKPDSTVVFAYGQLTLAWRALNQCAPGDQELVHCALKTSSLISQLDSSASSTVPSGIYETARSLAKRIDGATFITPPEVKTQLAA